jgi:hypothetical protein
MMSMWTHLGHARPQSFLAPGQRYARSGRPAWRTDNQLTILVVGRDRSGLVWATYRGPHGADTTALAPEVEMAVVSGEIVPVIDGRALDC